MGYTTKSNVEILPISLRFVAVIASLAAVICFGKSQGLHDIGAVESADLGHHLVTPATGTVGSVSFIDLVQSVVLIISDRVCIHLVTYNFLHRAFDSRAHPSWNLCRL